MTDEATAFVPGHVTGFFSVHRSPDPYVAGSRGAGVTLTDGVRVAVRPAASSSMSLNGEEVVVDAAMDVLDTLGVTAEVEAETPLPLGAGFGVSGAAALGTALAANAVFDCGRTEDGLVSLAHAAEVRAGTGLGDVVAQARGGVPVRRRPGPPGRGRLDGVPATARVEYLSLGTLSTSAVLSGDTDDLSAAGERALEALLARPTLEEFVRLSRRFADEAGLLTDDLRAVLDDAAGPASMAMLGETAFAPGTALTDAGYDAAVCRVHPSGATLEGD